jgi:thiol-disulfide isomerase/thioredoxin
MRSRFMLTGVMALVILSAPRGVRAQDDPTKLSPEALIARVAEAKDSRSFFPPYYELVKRVDQSGTDGEAAARLVLAHRPEITAEHGVTATLDALVEQMKPQLAARLLLQIARSKATVRNYKKGNVVVGRIKVADGKLDPELVMAQMEILPEGYFAGEVGDLERPIGFRAEGYLSLDVPLKGKTGEVVDLGTITLKALPANQAASVKGKVALDDLQSADSPTIKLSVSVPKVNTPHNGYSPRRRWPESISVPVSKSGEFQIAGLSPIDHMILIDAKGHDTFMKRLTLSPGSMQNAGTIKLKSNDIGFYIRKPAPKTGELRWEKDYHSALSKAKAENKPLMVMMTATWCGPCKALESETLNNPWIRYFLADFVIVKAYEDAEVEKIYGGNGYPTLVFTDPSGKEAERTVGYQTTVPFAGVCAKAMKKLGTKLPAELKMLAEKKLIEPQR